ncbi:MAG: hypothetical protein JO334_12415 [Verrucomicrobia bacterium]|nr:hypothetical protein [Verrucomicrobiota bacterium]
MKTDLAAPSGIHSAGDVIKMLMAGADVTMLCSIYCAVASIRSVPLNTE